MSNISPSNIRYLEKALDSKKSKSTRKRSSSQTAVVTRVDQNGQAWIHIPGGAAETPAKFRAADVSKGDIVNVVVQNGYARIDGNVTAPAASDRTVRTVTVTMQEEAQAMFDKLEAKTATIEELKAAKADIQELETDTAKIHNLTAEELSAATGYISDLTTGSVTAQDIIGNKATISSLSSNYAQINGANITNLIGNDSWFDKLMVQTGMIANQGNVYQLDAIQVNASSITAGTIDVERLIVSVPDPDHPEVVNKYMIHVDPQTSQTVYEKLDGNVIEDLTITADKIAAGAITADKITAYDIEGPGGKINLRNGTFAYINAQTGQGIVWDGSNLTIAGSVEVGGTDILLSRLAEMTTNTLIYDHTYIYNNNGTVTFTAHLYRGGEDVAGTTDFPASQFSWYKRSETPDIHGNTEIQLGTGLTCTVSLADAGYGAHIIGRYTPMQSTRLLTENDDSLMTSNDETMMARTASGGSVRVSDLSVATTLYSTDKLMVVGAEDEHLVTVAKLQETIAPSIEGVSLIGDKSFPDLGIFIDAGEEYPASDEYAMDNADILAIFNAAMAS